MEKKYGEFKEIYDHCKLEESGIQIDDEIKFELLEERNLHLAKMFYELALNNKFDVVSGLIDLDIRGQLPNDISHLIDSLTVKRSFIEPGEGRLTCINCKWWCKTNPPGANTGECRRYPPQIVEEKHTGGMIIHSKWPRTGAMNFCGEWKESENQDG